MNGYVTEMAEYHKSALPDWYIEEIKRIRDGIQITV